MSESDQMSRSDESAEDLLAGGHLLRRLIETRSTRTERLSQPDVAAAIREVGAAAKSADGKERLDAVSLLGKAMETFNAKVAIQLIRDELRAALSQPLAPLDDWGLAIDRYYLALALRESAAEWVARYAARSFAQAGLQEEKARDVWAELAVVRAPSLASALRELTDALADLTETEDSPQGTGFRRIIRICRGLSGPLPTMDIPLGEDFGKAFLALTRNLDDGTKGAEAARLREEAAVAILELTSQILRFRFESIFLSDLYRAAGAIRGWWRPGRPPDSVEELSDRILRLAMSGIHILSRQGSRDTELRQTLSRAFGPQKVDAQGRRLATGDLSLAPNDAEWLSTGRDHRATKSNDAVRALTDAETDALIGDLLSAQARPDADPMRLRNVADAVELYDGNAAELMRAFANQLRVNAQLVEAIAHRRGLRSQGRYGEIVTFDPTTHEAHSVIQRGASVRISAPGVIRDEPGKQPVMIKKALVEEH